MTDFTAVNERRTSNMKLETIVREANEAQKEAVCEALIASMGKLSQEGLESLTEEIYEIVYGCHFNRETYEEAVSSMVNEDGTTGEHWTATDLSDLGKDNTSENDRFNLYDFAYTANMLYSDYCQLLGSDREFYMKLSLAFLNDRDAPNGKAWKYYRAMKRDNKF